MTFDAQRLTEHEQLLRLITIASSLNRGSHVVEKIQELELLADALSRSDYDAPRCSFLNWITSAVIEARQSAVINAVENTKEKE